MFKGTYSLRNVVICLDVIASRRVNMSKETYSLRNVVICLDVIAIVG